MGLRGVGRRETSAPPASVDPAVAPSVSKRGAGFTVATGGLPGHVTGRGVIDRAGRINPVADDAHSPEVQEMRRKATAVLIAAAGLAMFNPDDPTPGNTGSTSGV